MTENKLNIGVIGTGYLGKFHLEKYQNNENVTVRWVVDKNIKGISLDIKKNVQKTDDYRDIINDVDAVSIVTPTSCHYEIAKYFIKNKVHVLVEKPMTRTVSEAKKLNQLAEDNNIILQVGHLERFNPVMKKLKTEVSNPVFIEVHRLSEFNPRSTDVNVVHDLMIHDIDLILSLMNKKIKKVSAFGRKIITNSTDIANVRIEFIDESIANLTSSRISAKNERKFRVFESNKYFSVDFLESNIKIFSKNQKKSSDLYSRKEHSYNKSDSLKAEIENFVLSCMGKEKPLVTGIDGMNALKVADDISKKL